MSISSFGGRDDCDDDSEVSEAGCCWAFEFDDHLRASFRSMLTTMASEVTRTGYHAAHFDAKNGFNELNRYLML
ncbi:hypothetical protein ACHAXR_000483 [Thalassiosira sp. AJA248-18]